MKRLTFILFVLMFIGFFAQCKKSNPPQQQGVGISNGHYFIRTKYMCDGKAYVLGSFSNREYIAWQPVSPEDLKAIKGDGPIESNPFIWEVGDAVTHGGTVAPGPAPAGALSGRNYFSIYQDDLSDPANPYRWYLTTPNGASSTDDQTGFGIGPSIFATQAAFSDEDLSHTTIRATYFSVTDSTGRIAVYGTGSTWWILSLPTDPDDICTDFNSKVIWRNSWLCPNTTSIGNAWKWDACAISQLVFEKID